MKIYFTLDENSRLLGWSNRPGSVSDFELDVDASHEVIRNPFIFKYENGTLVKDEAYQQQLINEAQNKPLTTQEELASLKKSYSELAFDLMMKGVI